MVQGSTRAWNALHFARTFSREAAGNSGGLQTGVQDPEQISELAIRELGVR